MAPNTQADVPGRTAIFAVATAMAVAGLVSGIASAVFPDSFANALNPISKLFFLDGSAVHPGLFFGSAIALVLGWLGERRVWALALTLIVVSVAWSAAVNTAVKVYDIKDVRTLFDATVTVSASPDPTTSVKLLAGFAAGLVGALLMVAGLAIVVPPLRNGAAWTATAVLGGTAGLLIYPFLNGWNQTGSLILLFAVWQASVGACIGVWLARQRRTRQPSSAGLGESAGA